MINEMMNHPVVSATVLSYLRSHLNETDNVALQQIRQEAQLKRLPIIPLETASFFRLLMKIHRPQQILEVGTAIGYSAILMALEDPQIKQIITFERNPVMYRQALVNIQRFELEAVIKVQFGDVATQYDQFQKDQFDLIFLDGAKSKYLSQFQHLIVNLKPSGIMIIDDVFQGGDTFRAITQIKHRNKGIHRHLNQLLTEALNQKKYISTLLPLGDGILMLQKANK